MEDISNSSISPLPQNARQDNPSCSVVKQMSIPPDVIQNCLYGKKYTKLKCRGAGNLYNDANYFRDYTDPIFSGAYGQEAPTIPKHFMIERSTIPGEVWGVFTTSWIKEGTQMGPFTGRLVGINQLNMEAPNDSAWEVFDSSGAVKFFIDANTECFQSWIHLIKCARSEQEQNLDLVQQGSRLLYRANKDIPPNQELLVWYNNSVSQFLGIPDTASEVDHSRGRKFSDRQGLHIAKERLLTGRLRCTVCRRGFNSRSNLRSHMRIHTMERPFQCKYCKKCFSQSSTLRNHTRLHTGEKPYQCNVCHMAYSQLAGLRAHQKSARHKPDETHVSLNEISMVLSSKYRNDESCCELPPELTFSAE